MPDARKKLWEKTGPSLDKVIEEFTVGNDYLLDMNLAVFDVYGNAAHAKMLNKIQIISNSELTQILTGLKQILQEIQQKSFQIKIEDEDIHTKIEYLLVEKIGDSAKKIHTARSRNDQVLLDLRLYMKDNLIQFSQKALNLSKQLALFAMMYEFIPMPGYTHMQIAMPSSVGMWTSAFVENMLDEIQIVEAIYNLNDMNPLGSGAGYGTSIDIDRQLTTDLLGFKRIQKNPIYCGNSRGKIEAQVVGALANYALILNRIAVDLLIFTTKEFDFFKFKENIATGSSIMPQKKNLDVMELVRGRTHILLSNENQIKNIICNLPSGYNRDYQDTKKLLVQSFETINQIIDVVSIVFKSIEPNKPQLIKAFKPEIYATDVAYRLVKQGIPFRDAYRKVGQTIGEIQPEDPEKNIKTKKHIGATGNLQLNSLLSQIDKKKIEWDHKDSQFHSHLNKLFD